MLSPEQVETLIAELTRTAILPLDPGDRLDVAVSVIGSTIRRLAPKVTLDTPEGPTGIVPGAEEEKAPPDAG